MQIPSIFCCRPWKREGRFIFFLLPDIKFFFCFRTTGNFEEGNVEELDKDTESDSETTNIIGDTETRPPIRPFKKPQQKTQLTTFQYKLLEKLEKPDSVEDPDKAFLLSLVPDMKKLNDDDKLDFPFHVLQFFRDKQQTRMTTTQQTASFPQSSTSFRQPSTSFHQQSTLFPRPSTSFLQPSTYFPQQSTSFPQQSTSYPQPPTSYPQPSTSYIQPSTSFPQPYQHLSPQESPVTSPESLSQSSEQSFIREQ